MAVNRLQGKKCHGFTSFMAVPAVIAVNCWTKSQYLLFHGLMHQSFVAPSPPEGIAGTLIFCQAKHCQKPHTTGTANRLNPHRFPLQYVIFSIHCLFAPGIFPSLRGQCKSKNTAHFYGYPPRAVLTNDLCIRGRGYK